MLKRNDVHRPSVIDPDEYRFVSFHSHRGEDVFAAMAEADNFRRDMASTGGKFSTHEHGGSCHVCGKIGRASCRERVEVSVGDGSLKNNKDPYEHRAGQFRARTHGAV